MCSLSINEVDQLTQADIWNVHGPDLWRTRSFVDCPEFYPVYEWEGYYSFSPTYLLEKKGVLNLDAKVAKKVAAKGFRYLSGNGTIDKEIRRIGGPVVAELQKVSVTELTMQVASAMKKDITLAEKQNPGKTNIVLCGGVDSLNLLLLPWSNPVIVASAPPNDVLVHQFVVDNQLGYDVVSLDDSDSSLLGEEVWANFCRNDLAHCRWGPHVRKLSEQIGHEAIIWKGQLADVFLTEKWRSYAHPRDLESLLSHLPNSVLRMVSNRTAWQSKLRRSYWERGAMWQGAHMSMLRQLTDTLVLSAYHGPEVSKLRARVDFRTGIIGDVRMEVGALLAGGPVHYPTTNPGPPPSSFRSGHSHVTPLLEELKTYGVRLAGE